MKKLLVLISMIGLLFLLSCNEESPVEQSTNFETPSLNKKSDNIVSPILNNMNAKLEIEGAKVRVAYAEWVTIGESEQNGRNIYFSNIGNKQLSAHWVPGLTVSGDEKITWAKEQLRGEPNGVSKEDANSAIDRAMETWQNAQCSEIPLVESPDFGLDLGYVQYLIGYGGIGGWIADISDAGWLPGAFFDFVLGSGSSNNVLGVTFTFIWIDDITGEPTDIDNNRKSDVAFREIYYNNNFSWATDGVHHYDVETIVLHETGHGLSQAHFGTAFRTTSNNVLHFSPRAVMNAGYSGIQHELTGTDNAGHCSIWASWPNN